MLCTDGNELREMEKYISGKRGNYMNEDNYVNEELYARIRRGFYS